MRTDHSVDFNKMARFGGLFVRCRMVFWTVRRACAVVSTCEILWTTTMTADAVLRDALDPGLDLLASIGGPRRDARADALLLTIAGQESAWTHRAQRVKRRDGTWGLAPRVACGSSSDQVALPVCCNIAPRPDWLVNCVWPAT